MLGTTVFLAVPRPLGCSQCEATCSGDQGCLDHLRGAFLDQIPSRSLVYWSCSQVFRYSKAPWSFWWHLNVLMGTGRSLHGG